MSWLSKALGGIRFDSHTLGNLVKNIAPALALTPVGMVGAGLAGAAGEALRGKTGLRDLASAGISNATLGGGLRAGVGAIRGAMNSGVAGAAPTTAGATPNAVTAGGSPAALSPASVTGAAPAAVEPTVAAGGAGGPSPYNLFKSVGSGVQGAAQGAGGPSSAFGKVWQFAKDNPLATGMALQGAGNIATSGTTNRINSAQAGLLEQQHSITAEEQARRKALDEWLSTQLPDLTMAAPAANPYTHPSTARSG